MPNVNGNGWKIYSAVMTLVSVVLGTLAAPVVGWVRTNEKDIGVLRAVDAVQEVRIINLEERLDKLEEMEIKVKAIYEKVVEGK